QNVSVRHLIQIVPQPTAICGVSHYAALLARQLRVVQNVHTQFIAAGSAGRDNTEGFPVYALAQRSSAALLNALTTANRPLVLLHYVGYGYHKRACPFWLLRGLEEWRKADTA